MYKNIKFKKYYWFIGSIFIFKILIMGLFSSDYQYKMFIPFINNFIEGFFSGRYNPYEYYYLNNFMASFPYPPIMLFIESIGGIIIHIFSIENLFLKNIIFKLPNLFFDFVGMYYLQKLLPDKRKYVAVFYYLSPIIIYSTFMHGQLDIIPTAFFVGAIYYISSKENHKELKFIIMYSLGLSTKLHVLTALPIFVVYMMNKRGLKYSLKIVISCIVVTGLIMLPFMGNGFLYTVLLNNEQSVLLKVYINFVNIKLYIPLFVLGFIYLRGFELVNINKNLLISYCGLLFAVFLILIPPMPGWYVWIIPFVTIFFAEIAFYRNKKMVMFFLLNLFYLFYFVFLHKSNYIDLYFLNKSLNYLKIHNEFLSNTVFTILVCILVYSIYLLYQLGNSSNSFYKISHYPFVIGVTGDSGSGKSTFYDMAESILDKKNILQIEGDGDHKWERNEKMWDIYSHLNPKGNFLYRQAQDLEILKNGASAMRVDYDHNTGKFTQKKKFKPKKFIVLCGLHALYLPQMRRNIDLKIYMDIDENLRCYWKIQRDISKRGYDENKILEQIKKRSIDAEKYIIPQKKYADLIITYFDKNLKNCLEKDFDIHLSLKLTFDAMINIEPVIYEFSRYNISAKYEFSEDLNKQTVIFDGETLDNIFIDFQKIAESVIPQLDEITEQDFSTENNINGILKIFFILLLSNKMQKE